MLDEYLRIEYSFLEPSDCLDVAEEGALAESVSKLVRDLGGFSSFTPWIDFKNVVPKATFDLYVPRKRLSDALEGLRILGDTAAAKIAAERKKRRRSAADRVA